MPQLVAALHSFVGMAAVLVGWESNNLRSLEEYRAVSKQGRDRLDALHRIRDHGLDVMLFIMVGGRQDMRADYDDIRELCVRHKVAAHPVMTTPFPGTQLYEQYRERQRELGESRARLAALHGRTIRIALRGTGMQWIFVPGRDGRLRVAPRPPGEQLELLARRQRDRAEGLGFVGLAVAEEAPHATVGGVVDVPVPEVAVEPGVVQRRDRTEAHRDRGELPEVGHQARVRIAREAFAGHDLAAEVVQL